MPEPPLSNTDTLASVASNFIDELVKTLQLNGLDNFASALGSHAIGKVQRGPLPRCQHESLSYLDRLHSEIGAAAMRNAAATLDWGQVYDGGGIDQSLAEGMFAAQAIGSYGVFASQQLAAGMFMLAPGVYYPLHTHAAREVYCCLAGEIEIQHRLDSKQITLTRNQCSETPSGRLHSLRTRQRPVLLAYIWTGDINAPTWWWERDKDQNWQRNAWRRKPGESWKLDRREAVSERVFAEAMK